MVTSHTPAVELGAVAQLPALLAAAWIVLHGPDGQVIHLNPGLAVNVRTPRGTEQRHFPPGTQCIVFTVDGRFLSVAEPCPVVLKRLQGQEP